MAYQGGSGMPWDPYQIATKADILDLYNGVDRTDKHFILVDDVDMTGHTLPQGIYMDAHLDGRGHTIHSFDQPGSVALDSGVFRTLQRGYSLRNLRVMTGAAGVVCNGSNYATGLLAGELYENAVLENSIALGKMNCAGGRGGGAVGICFRNGNFEPYVMKNIFCFVQMSNMTGSYAGPVLGYNRSTATLGARNIFWSSEYAGVSASHNLSTVSNCVNLTNAQRVNLANYPSNQGFVNTSGVFKIDANGFPDFNRPAPGVVQNGQVGGVLTVGGSPAARPVIALSADTVNGSRVVIAETITAPADGSYSLILPNFIDPVILVALDTAGQPWAASTVCSAGDRVYPSASGHTGRVYQCTGAGTSGASEPSWPVVLGDAVDDGTAQWTAVEYFRPLAHGPVIPTVL